MAARLMDRQGEFELHTTQGAVEINAKPGHDPGSDDPSSSMAHSSSSSSDAEHSSTDECESQNGASTGVEQVAGDASAQQLISLTVPTAKRAQKRKRIRKVLDDTKLFAETQEVQRRERERRERLDAHLRSLLAHEDQPSTSSLDASIPSGLPTNDIAGKREEQGKAVEVIELSSDDEDYSQVSQLKPPAKWGHIRPAIPLLGSRGILARRDDLPFPSRLAQPVYRQRRHSGDLENTERTSDGHLLVNAGKPPGDPEIFVAEHLADVLQPHQLGGVRFMYDNIIESVQGYKNSEGFGCILAHSMGLGKTIQVITFTDIFLRATDARKVLVIVPINTIQNWKNEFDLWMPRMTPNGQLLRRFPVLILGDGVKGNERFALIDEWDKGGGVLLIGYEMFRILLQSRSSTTGKGVNRRARFTSTRVSRGGEWMSAKTNSDTVVDLEAEETRSSVAQSQCMLHLFDHRGDVGELKHALLDPGPDLVVCDEGHRIKNLKTEIANALNHIRTKRRIVMTGYPLQNNLMEYFCMVDFVRPMHLGTRKQFANMFERPIKNGQCVDSTKQDVKIARQRTHVLVEQLKGFVQRRTHHLLRSILPPNREFVLLLRKSAIQRALYRAFVIYAQSEMERGTTAIFNPLKAFAACCKIWNHPDLLHRMLLKQRQLSSQATIQSSSLTAYPSSTLSANHTTSFNPSSALQALAMRQSMSSVFESNNGSQLPALFDDDFPEPDSSSSCSQFASSNAHDYNRTSANYDAITMWSQQPETAIRHAQEQFANGSSFAGSFSSPTGQYHRSHSAVASSTDFLQPRGSLPPSGQSSPYPQRMTSSLSMNDLFADFDPDDVYAESTTSSISNIATAINRPKNAQIAGGTIDDPRLAAGLRYDWAETVMRDYLPGLVENGYKMAIAFAIIDAATRRGEKVLLFSQSLLTLDLIEEYLCQAQLHTANGEATEWRKNRNYFRFDGSTSASEREKLIARFNKETGIHLFLISTRAGSLGINLVASSRVIIYDASWNPCHDAQAVCRVYRYGQRRATFIYRLIVDNSMERAIFNRQISKNGLQQRVVDDHQIDANVTQRELETLLVYDEALDVRSEEWDIDDWNVEDDVLIDVASRLSHMFAQCPFLHESLMLEREDAMSEQEKLEARLLYERERNQLGRSMGTGDREETVLSSLAPGRAPMPAERLWSGPSERLWAGPATMPAFQRASSLRPPLRASPFPMTVQPVMNNSVSSNNSPISRPGGFVNTGFDASAANRVEVPQAEKVVIDRELALPAVGSRHIVSVFPGQEVWVARTAQGVYLRLADGQVLDAKNTVYDHRVTSQMTHTGINTNSASPRLYGSNSWRGTPNPSTASTQVVNLSDSD